MKRSRRRHDVPEQPEVAASLGGRAVAAIVVGVGGHVSLGHSRPAPHCAVVEDRDDLEGHGSATGLRNPLSPNNLMDSVSRWFWRGSQVVRQRSAKPLFAGSIPARASESSYDPSVRCRSGVCGSDADSRRMEMATAVAADARQAYEQDVSEYRWLILLGLITAAIMEVLDTTIINVALPQMAGNLGATNQEIAWVSTGYILSNVVVLPMTAFLTGDIRPPELSDGVDHHLHRRVVPLRHVAHARRARALAHRAGRGRRRAAVDGAGHAPADLSARAAGNGAGDLHPRHHRRADARTDAGRMDHGQLHWNWCFFINVPIGIVSVFLVDDVSARSAGHAAARPSRSTGRASGC